jgi:hypothetical protein
MGDSPLSITASVTGILTFIVAIILWFFAHAQSLRRVDNFNAEMLRTISGAKMLDELTKASDHHHGSKSLSSAITREVIVDMYKLGLRVTLRIINLFYGNARFRMAF